LANAEGSKGGETFGNQLHEVVGDLRLYELTTNLKDTNHGFNEPLVLGRKSSNARTRSVFMCWLQKTTEAKASGRVHAFQRAG